MDQQTGRVTDRKRLIRLAGWAAAALISCRASAVSLTPVARERLVSATFEVVVAKPTSDPLSYEKPLPLDLLPYAERTDLYRSIGTAFLIAPNQFVTAGHVIISAAGSQYGPIAIRDTAGKTYRIDKVIKYSATEDFAVFSVVNPPNASPLETRARPAINDAVFAVGNAFGEGVVARDGLYTSDTPEELDGRWKWLRFSAAASPGNSGGPLVDRNGKVVGVVLRKSPNENLNFAVAIDQVISGSTEHATFESRMAYRPAVANASDVSRLNQLLPLPQPIDDFYASVLKLSVDWHLKNRDAYFKAHGANIFPHGSHSKQLLSYVYVAPSPRLIAEADNGHWTAFETKVDRETLENNGFFDSGNARGVGLGRLRLPDRVSLIGMLEDSAAFGELLLKAKPLHRPVGADRVRVTSFGKAQQEQWHTDHYGRRWLLRAWNVPFNDGVIVVDALPTPEGFALLLIQGTTGARDGLEIELRSMADFVYVSLNGSLRRWREYLDHPAIQPDSVKSLQLQFDYGRQVAIKSPKFQMLVPAALQAVQADSRLELKFTFVPAADDATWEVGGVFLADSNQENRFVDVLRRVRPGDSMPEDFTHRWHAMTTAEAPYDAVPYAANGGRRIEVMVNAKDAAAGKAPVGYTVAARAESTQSDRYMKKVLETIERGFTIAEH